VRRVSQVAAAVLGVLDGVGGGTLMPKRKQSGGTSGGRDPNRSGPGGGDEGPDHVTVPEPTPQHPPVVEPDEGKPAEKDNP
jgi:hypothetical protein